MVVFLTTIRHPQNSNNFAEVEKLFEITLRSVCAQTDPNFSVVVVCNARPQIAHEDPRVIYHVVDFPPPSAERRAEIAFFSMLRDKGTKLLAGMLRARSLNPDYFMIFDADDLVSRQIAGYVNARPDTPGWYVDACYLFNHSTHRIQRKYGMVRYCGTSLIPNASDMYRLAQLDGSLTDNASQEEILAKATPWFVDHVIGNHAYMIGYLNSHGRRMKPIPFRAAAWVQETGENQLASHGTKTGLPVPPWFIEEFGLTQLAPDAQAPATAAERWAERVGCIQSWMSFQRYRLRGHLAPPSSP